MVYQINKENLWPPFLQSNLGNPLFFQANHETFEGSQDAQKLETIFRELSACKDDSQQRSWFLHEDEHTITTHLNELLSILVRSAYQCCRWVVIY